MSFFAELKRRNVFKVGAAYLVVAWLIIQLVNNVAGPLQFPAWIPAFFIVLLGIGFPVALLLAWALELTPEGIKLTTSVEPEESIRPQTGRKLNVVIISGLSAALLLVVVDAYVLTAVEEPSMEALAVEAPAVQAGVSAETPADLAETAVPAKSIAVLPFTNQSNDPDQDYFADGLSEELLNRLARVQDLLVAGRTSSFYFKGRSEDLREIGRQLGVAHVLEGSVRKAGNNVRVSAQLIRADNGFQLWSDSYDSNLDDIFMIQDEIAAAVTTALSVTLSAGEFDRPGMTVNVQAYEAFLRADTSTNPEPEKNLATIEHLEAAVAIDPDFGLAWNALYRAYEFATISLPPDLSAEFVALTGPALERAQQLMPQTPEVLVSSAMSQRRMGNFVDAETLFVASITAYGNSDAAANLNYGELLWSVGRLTDALPYLQRARRLDPKLADISARLGSTLLALGQIEAARSEILRGIAANPDNGFISAMMAVVSMTEGNFQTFEDSAAGQPFGEPGEVMLQVLKTWLTGDQSGARAQVRDYVGNKVFAPVIATMIGPTAALVGDNELALTLFAVSPDANINDTFGSFTIWQNFMGGMRQLDGFKSLVADAGLLDYWRTTGNWGEFCRPLAGNDDFECF